MSRQSNGNKKPSSLVQPRLLQQRRKALKKSNSILGLIFSKKLKKSCLKNPVFVSKTAQLGVHLKPHYLLKKGFAVSFLYGNCTVSLNKTPKNLA